MPRFAVILLFPLLLSSQLLSNAEENPLHTYLEQKALCNYEQAMDILEDWSMRLDDPVVFEANIFRINELVKYNTEIHMAVDDFNGSYMPFLSSQCTVHKVNGKFPLKKITNFLSILKLIYMLKPQIIYTNLWTSAFLILNALHFYRKPLKFIFGNTIGIKWL